MSLEQPSLGNEIEDRAAQRAKIAALFQAHPLMMIHANDLKAITPHYQQRISELRRKHGMNIENVPQSVPDLTKPRYRNGEPRRKKIDGAYRYLTYDRLGRDAGMPTLAPWNQDRPFAEGFKLT